MEGLSGGSHSAQLLSADLRLDPSQWEVRPAPVPQDTSHLEVDALVSMYAMN